MTANDQEYINAFAICNDIKDECESAMKVVDDARDSYTKEKQDLKHLKRTYDDAMLAIASYRNKLTDVEHSANSYAKALETAHALCHKLSDANDYLNNLEHEVEMQ